MGGGGGEGVFPGEQNSESFSTYDNVSICNDYQLSLTILGLGVKFSRWGKNSLGGVKI